MTPMNPRVDILLVEDNEDDAELAIRALKTHGISEVVLHMRDGREAVEYVFNPETQPPRLILLDIKMPVMDGLEVLRRIKMDEGKKSIPVVMLTTSMEEPDIKECYQIGANAYLLKPVDYNKFTAVAAQLKLFWLTLNTEP
jgi:two-component system response regulator